MRLATIGSVATLLAAPVLWAGAAVADPRPILYPAAPQGALAEVAGRIADLDAPKVPYAELRRQGPYLVRIAPREYVLSPEDGLKQEAILGTKPFVFVTTPESVAGKSLLEIYLDIGYEAEDIIRRQNGTEMVAIAFRYGDEVGFWPGRDGPLPAAGLRAQVYVPTWSNVFALFARLAAEAQVLPDQGGGFAPERLFFSSVAERWFVLGFPPAGRERVASAGYAALKATGGSDWVYRELLERKLSIVEHFRGNGRTLNETVDPDGLEPEAGLLEFMAPNRRLAELSEVAVIHLGTLRIGDDYGP